MIRKASRADLPRIFEISAVVRENRLRDPSLVTSEVCEWCIDNAALWLWEENSVICGFSAIDPREGSIFVWLVDPEHEGHGIGQLVTLACVALSYAGNRFALVSAAAGTRAERFYRENGWNEDGRQLDGQIIFQRQI